MGLQDCLDEIVSWLNQRNRARYFVCANPHSLVVARTDAQFRQAILESDLIVADGAGIVLASRLLGGTIPYRVTGFDLFMGVSEVLSAMSGMRCFFLGSTPDTLEKIKDRMAVRFPRLEVVGCYSPPFVSDFSSEENDRMLQAIHQARPHVLWVGLTAPKQEKWIHAHIHRLEVPIVGPIGAVFDFFTGKVHRSAPVFQHLGLEWLPRLIQNPRHLWKRTFVSAPIFLWAVLRQRLSSLL
ncbi:MAG TPA: WecB/TagA/CpsF family glycosyltransferase [Magnetococcales bacterium]|nr:WecB/TagA/CpsF family glycosyltransferase [Magnetococcales bacterium]